MNPTNNTGTRQACVADIDAIAPLFDAYRVFYGKPSDLALARAFLRERFQNNQSVIFLTLQNEAAVGFAQLYPSFSSVSATRTFILNDLFVAPEARRAGVATELLRAAADYGRAVGAIRLSLSTATTNEAAQALYSSEGWARDTEFYAYDLTL